MFREIVVPVTFGLALFLFGMKIMEAALQTWAGPRLIKLLHSSTQNALDGNANQYWGHCDSPE